MGVVCYLAMLLVAAHEVDDEVLQDVVLVVELGHGHGLHGDEVENNLVYEALRQFGNGVEEDVLAVFVGGVLQHLLPGLYCQYQVLDAPLALGRKADARIVAQGDDILDEPGLGYERQHVVGGALVCDALQVGACLQHVCVCGRQVQVNVALAYAEGLVVDAQPCLSPLAEEETALVGICHEAPVGTDSVLEKVEVDPLEW